MHWAEDQPEKLADDIRRVLNLDLPVVIGVVILVSISISAANLLVDILYPLLDPRTRAR